jgi:hypothetical protein
MQKVESVASRSVVSERVERSWVRARPLRRVEVRAEPVAEEPDMLKGTPEQLAEALARFEQVGVGTVALQFMAPRYPERLEQIERFATEALPRLSV